MMLSNPHSPIKTRDQNQGDTAIVVGGWALKSPLPTVGRPSGHRDGKRHKRKGTA